MTGQVSDIKAIIDKISDKTLSQSLTRLLKIITDSDNTTEASLHLEIVRTIFGAVVPPFANKKQQIIAELGIINNKLGEYLKYIQTKKQIHAGKYLPSEVEQWITNIENNIKDAQEVVSTFKDSITTLSLPDSITVKTLETNIPKLSMPIDIELVSTEREQCVISYNIFATAMQDIYTLNENVNNTKSVLAGILSVVAQELDKELTVQLQIQTVEQPVIKTREFCKHTKNVYFTQHSGRQISYDDIYRIIEPVAFVSALEHILNRVNLHIVRDDEDKKVISQAEMYLSLVGKMPFNICHEIEKYEKLNCPGGLCADYAPFFSTRAVQIIPRLLKARYEVLKKTLLAVLKQKVIDAGGSEQTDQQLINAFANLPLNDIAQALGIDISSFDCGNDILDNSLTSIESKFSTQEISRLFTDLHIASVMSFILRA